MDLDTATELTSPAPPRTALPELRAELAQHHAAEPQRALLASHALDLIEEAMGKLASLGHRFLLSRDVGSEPEEYPKMLYRKGEWMSVDSKGAEGTARKDGWGSQDGVDPPTRSSARA